MGRDREQRRGGDLPTACPAGAARENVGVSRLVPRTALARWPRLGKPDADFLEGNTAYPGGPALARLDRHGERQRAGRDDLARAERWIVRIVREQFDQVTQRLQG